ncbi:hypothetical protein GCM10008949_21420 [Deinococcus humi]|nr:hypothetical protein GCM10008949_21420 [Deinococcus humi]
MDSQRIVDSGGKGTVGRHRANTDIDAVESARSWPERNNVQTVKAGTAEQVDLHEHPLNGYGRHSGLSHPETDATSRTIATARQQRGNLTLQCLQDGHGCG